MIIRKRNNGWGTPRGCGVGAGHHMAPHFCRKHLLQTYISEENNEKRRAPIMYVAHHLGLPVRNVRKHSPRNEIAPLKARSQKDDAPARALKKR